MISLTKKINKSFFVAIVLTTMIILFLFLNQSQNNTSNISNNISTSNNKDKSESFLVNVLIGSDVFLSEIEKLCPFYEPDGITYKECLSDLFNMQELALNQQFKKLLIDLDNSKIANEKSGLSSLSYMYEYLIQDLKEYNKLWKPYISTICSLENTGSINGTGYSAFLMTCKLNEIRKISLMMSEIDEDYNMSSK